MKYAFCLVCTVLISGCAPTSSSSRRPLSTCAQRLIERGYLKEQDTQLADTYCRTRSQEELVAARWAVDAGTAATFQDAITLTLASAAVVQPAPAPEPLKADDGKIPQALDVMSIAESDPNLSTFVDLLNASGMAEAVRGAKAVTLLAPTNAAFEKYPRLADNKTRLKKVLSMHVIMDELSCADAPVAPERPRRVATMGGKRLPLRAKGEVVSIGRAKVLRADLTASNGGVDIIDTVLLP